MFAAIARSVGLLWALALVLVACVPADGQGHARVAILPMEGKKVSAVDEELTRVVEERYDVISGKKYQRTAKRLKARSKGPKHVRKVARKLDLDAVLQSTLVKKGKKKYELRVRLLAGETGQEIDEFKVKLSSAKLSGKSRRSLRSKLYAALAAVEGRNQDVDQDEAQEVGDRRRRGDSKRSARERLRARRLREKQQEQQLRKEAKQIEREDREEDEAERRRDKKREKRMAQIEDDEVEAAEDDTFEGEEDLDEDVEERKPKRKADKKAARKAEKPSKSEKSSKSSEVARDDEKRSSKKQKSGKTKKKKGDDKPYKVVTERDESTGQALDDENPL